MRLYEKVAFGIYAIYRPRIIKIARKYRSLSPIFGEEDLQQEALIAILQALRKYKHSPDIRMKFSTYLEWSIRNIFQRAIGNRDKYVEIYARDGAFEKTIGYGKFVGQKKALEDSGCTYTTKKRFCYLSEVLWDEDLEAKLDQAGLAPYEYPAGPPEKPAEMRETETGEQEEGEEAREEPEISAPGNGSGSHNGLNLQMIDGLYRQWARTRSVVNESRPPRPSHLRSLQTGQRSLLSASRKATAHSSAPTRWNDQRCPPSYAALPVTTTTRFPRFPFPCVSAWL